MYKLGLWLYDLLAGKQNIGQHQSLTQQQIHQACPELKTENLIKGFSYYDGQMDDHQLGLWALEQAKKSACHCEERSDVATSCRFTLCENTEVTKLDTQGSLSLADGTTQAYDKIINIAGAWAEQLLKQSNIKPQYNLDLVRGSHILVNTPSPLMGEGWGEGEKLAQHGYFLEIPNERRIFFVLPYQGKTLIGTTEQR